MNNKYIKKIQEIAESLDWSVSVDGEYITFQIYSSAGQDFNVELQIDEDDTVYEFIEKIYSYYDNFDVSEEAYYWLDSTGHGKNGAPYEMIDVYKDMEECAEEIKRLWCELHSYDWEEV